MYTAICQTWRCRLRYATDTDYIRFQGGVPDIYQEKGLWYIVHGYRADSPVIKTHKDPNQGELVALRMRGVNETIIFESSKLWMFEGAPCEWQSIRNGGSGYDRLHKNGQT